MNPKLRLPPFPWFGGKWRLADWIIPKLPPHQVYVEPFGGAASVLLQKPATGLEIYNDAEALLSNFFRVLRDKPDKLIRAVALSPYHREEFHAGCRALGVSRRKSDRCATASSSAIGRSLSPRHAVEKARLFAAIANQSFAGHFGSSWAYSRAGHDSARGMGKRCSRWLGTAAALYAVADRLAQVQIESGSAFKIIERYDARDACFYCDPPYYPDTRLSGEYSHELTPEQHEQLLDQLLACKGGVALSGYRCPLYDRKLRRWKRYTKRVYCKAERVIEGRPRSTRIEALWVKPR